MSKHFELELDSDHVLMEFEEGKSTDLVWVLSRKQEIQTGTGEVWELEYEPNIILEIDTPDIKRVIEHLQEFVEPETLGEQIDQHFGPKAAFNAWYETQKKRLDRGKCVVGQGPIKTYKTCAKHTQDSGAKPPVWECTECEEVEGD